MECRLRTSKAADWSCQISIRREVVVDSGNSTISESLFGERITNQADVEMMLRRAQLAVLDQKTSTSHFLDMEDDVVEAMMKSNTLPRFSRDVVCLQIAGPDLPTLSFVDLPGIIDNADGATIRLVQDLVRSYLDDNSLILVALTMSDDIENQSAAQLARDADPTGSRTIGVLTKPDTLDPGSSTREPVWLDIIEGRHHPLAHGYYCVRQPNDVERKMKGFTPSHAREIESAFFASTKPWSTSPYRDRFGTPNLGKTMSRLLIEMTQRSSFSLPTMKEKILTQSRSCDRDLRAMPSQVTSDPVIFVMGMVSTFVSTLAEYVRGSTTKAVLVQQNNAIYSQLHAAIRLTAPVFSLHNDCSTHRLGLFQRLPPGTWPGHEPRRHQSAHRSVRGIYLQTQIFPFCECETLGRSTLTDRSITRELPHHVPYAARESLIRAFQETWQQHITECFEAVKQNFSQLLQEIVHQHFGRFAALKAAVRSIIAEFLNVRAEKALDTIEYHLYSERTLLYTQNREYLAALREKYLAAYSKPGQPSCTKPGPSVHVSVQRCAWRSPSILVYDAIG
ncbi:P-loop containing nucleoside triphosphate hydrolase protein [Daedaleopsis nitida]|nr:P-loop containing nucleoside triphosphate hydrolase protein [Daedaleopsis nitida]